MNRKRVFGFLLFLGLWALFSPAKQGPRPVPDGGKIAVSATAAAAEAASGFLETLPSDPCFEESRPLYEKGYKAQEGLEDFICGHPKLKKLIVIVSWGYDEELFKRGMISGNPDELALTAEVSHGWLEEAKKHLPLEFEGLPVKIHESHLEASGPNSLCFRKASAWIDERNPKYQKIKKVHDRFVDSICECEAVKKHIIYSQLKADENGDPVFSVNMRLGWLEKAKKLLPAKFEGFPVEFLEQGHPSDLSWCTRNLRAWMRDGNPRFEEIKKIRERFVLDYLADRLEPVKEFISLSTGCDDQGEPYFEVGINHERMQVIKEKGLPDIWEGIPVKYGPTVEIKFFRD